MSCYSVLKRKKYGISVDIGTTNIIIHLVNLNDGKLADQLLLKNPQIEFGTDVLSRIKLARKDKRVREYLTLNIRQVVKREITDLLIDHDINATMVSDVVIVGNTVMHHLFFDLPTDSLTTPPYSATNKESILVSATDAGLTNLPNADVFSPPIVESFIGPDAIAVLVASKYYGTKKRCVTIDVGTNTEVSAITPEGIWIASAASGPAFEGTAIECGVNGEIGAIESVSIHPTTFEPTISVIGNALPHGICGTGAISLVASLLKAGLLLPRGSLNRETHSPWISFDSDYAYYIVAPKNTTSTGKEIVITQADLRVLQQSKAAIRAAIEIVVGKSGANPKEINELYMTGIFGSRLSIEDAYLIGMLPRFSNASILQVRNSAIHGADLLLNRENRLIVEDILQQLRYVELMENEEFNKLFIECLLFSSK